MNYRPKPVACRRPIYHYVRCSLRRIFLFRPLFPEPCFVEPVGSRFAPLAERFLRPALEAFVLLNLRPDRGAPFQSDARFASTLQEKNDLTALNLILALHEGHRLSLFRRNGLQCNHHPGNRSHRLIFRFMESINRSAPDSVSVSSKPSSGWPDKSYPATRSNSSADLRYTAGCPDIRCPNSWFPRSRRAESGDHPFLSPLHGRFDRFVQHGNQLGSVSLQGIESPAWISDSITRLLHTRRSTRRQNRAGFQTAFHAESRRYSPPPACLRS